MGLFTRKTKTKGYGRFEIPPPTERPPVDRSQIPEGARQRMAALADEGHSPDPDTADETLSRTDALGRFVTSNQNPFPIPAALREGPSAADEKGKGPRK